MGNKNKIFVLSNYILLFVILSFFHEANIIERNIVKLIKFTVENKPL